MTNPGQTVGPEPLRQNADGDLPDVPSGADPQPHDEAHYRVLFENMAEAFVCCRVIDDEQGVARDWLIVDANAAFCRLMDLSNVVGKKLSERLPGFDERNPGLLEISGRVVSSGRPEALEILTSQPSTSGWASRYLGSHRTTSWPSAKTSRSTRERRRPCSASSSPSTTWTTTRSGSTPTAASSR